MISVSADGKNIIKPLEVIKKIGDTLE